MTDRKKVVEKLELCRANPNAAGLQHYGELIVNIEVSLLDDVIDLLKAQEARVMTLEEVESQGDEDVIYIECLYPEKSVIKPAIYQPNNSSPDEDGYVCIVSSWGQSGFYHIENYGKRWRCWTCQPTDEQRNAVKWDD